MNDEEAGRMLERLAGRVPVGPAPVDQLLRAGRSAQRRRRQVALFGAAAATALALGGGVVAMDSVGAGPRGGNDTADGRRPTTPSGSAATPSGSAATPSGSAATDGDSPTQDRSGPLPERGAASCVERPTPGAIANRAFAFDGVVATIGPAHTNRPGVDRLDLVGVTFTVGEWFSGGTASRVTVDMFPPVPGTHDPTAETFSSYAIGSRLLVSGGPRQPRPGGSPFDDAIAWGCGFTRYYDQSTAQSWRRAVTAPNVPRPTSTRAGSTSVR
ncbi:hypothetical protein [Micromonospora sp. NPDC049171]|uniref:hypothetical protein n=1 Tax=Micromonospora sp. NPDC049171 TaxID=3155770 RepID=UPI0033F1E2D1